MLRFRKRVIRSLLIVLGVIGIYAGYTVATNNFHTVIAGELYRSARPTPKLIADWHKRYGIKTIVNLMGPHPEYPWYRAEKAAAEAHGITLIDYKMSAERDVTAEEVEEILSLLSEAERPILVHCRSGADRSGIVSAFYVAGVAGGSEYYAELQLTPFFGHLPFGFLDSYAMDRSFERAEPRLGFPDS
ncbi:MAG: tyrosine/serine protein phosphatase [Methyloceanibacter sp.]|nr:MAG: tyrosine/serine protein phosphatase [Methyloceanibacter sp.]